MSKRTGEEVLGADLAAKASKVEASGGAEVTDGFCFPLEHCFQSKGGLPSFSTVERWGS